MGRKRRRGRLRSGGAGERGDGGSGKRRESGAEAWWSHGAPLSDRDDERLGSFPNQHETLKCVPARPGERNGCSSRRGGRRMAATATPQSGTKDKNYDLITVTHLCLEHVWRLDQYAQDAEREGDQELASLFRRMQEHSRRGADECKKLLSQRLQEET